MLTATALVLALQTAPAADPPAAAPVLVGPGGEKYVGVVPGAATRNPLPPARGKDAQLIWSGFQMAEQGSRVFLQTTGPVSYEVKPGKAGTLSVFLRNCRIHLQNNRRHLDTRFFATPVRGVSAHQRRKDVELDIALKEPASPSPRTEPGPDGTQFLVFEFPLGKPAADTPPAATSPASAEEPERKR